MSRFPRALAAWGDAAFGRVLGEEVEALGVGALPVSRLSDTGYVLETGCSVEVVGADLVDGRIQARLRVWFQQIAAGCSCGFEAEPEPAMGELLVSIDPETGVATFRSLGPD